MAYKETVTEAILTSAISQQNTILDVDVKLSSYVVIMRIWKCPHITFHHNCQAPFPPFSFGLAEWWLLWRLRVFFQFLDLSVLGFVRTLTPDSTVFAFLGSLCFCLKCFPSLIIGENYFCLGSLSMLTKKANCNPFEFLLSKHSCSDGKTRRPSLRIFRGPY